MADPRLADFLVIGALKAATTSLAVHLSSHPDVFVSPTKELTFFNYEYNWPRGREWYESRFEGGDRCKARGEASPQYAWWPSYEGVPERASQVVPDARIIYVVRHPIARMVSMYKQAVRHGGERRSFARAILETSDYLDTSCYHTQIQRWLNCYPREQVLVVVTESLDAEPVGFMSTVYSFLGVDPSWVPGQLGVHHNASPDELMGSVDLPDAVSDLVDERLLPEVAAIQPLLPSTFDGWDLHSNEGVG